MIDLMDKRIPREAVQALKIIRELLGDQVVGIYLYGSAVMGGLQVNSDVDILVVSSTRSSESLRKELTERLIQISGKPGNANGLRPLEVTVVNRDEIVPWHFPAKYEMMYGEWLRDKFLTGEIPQPTVDPDFAILLAQARTHGIPLFGPDLMNIVDPVPASDIRQAIKESLPGLIGYFKGDERNVILTLARMWVTAATGEIISKDAAAEWAIPRLPEAQAGLLELAKNAYLGKQADHWEGIEAQAKSLVAALQAEIESCLE